jgi:hypothetical protein
VRRVLGTRGGAGGIRAQRSTPGGPAGMSCTARVRRRIVRAVAGFRVKVEP